MYMLLKHVTPLITACQGFVFCSSCGDLTTPLGTRRHRAYQTSPSKNHAHVVIRTSITRSPELPGLDAGNALCVLGRQ